MSYIVDNDLTIYKAMSGLVISKLQPVLKSLAVKNEEFVSKYYALRQGFLSCENLEKLKDYSAQMKELQDKLNRLISIQNRIEMIVQRNNERISYIQEKLNSSGIYNDTVDAKTLKKIIEDNKGNVCDELLNINQNADWAVTYKMINGEILAFYYGKLSFDNDFNIKQLSTFDGNFIAEIIRRYPESIATIPDFVYTDSAVKNRILKEIIIYAAEGVKKKSIFQINKELGSLLENVDSSLNLITFAKEVKNLFNVSAKKALKEFAPAFSDEIDDKLICNEASPYLPRNKRVAVLANGLAGDVIKTEENESEEVRKETEKENELVNEINEMLADLFEEVNEEQQYQQENKQDEDLQDQQEEGLEKEANKVNEEEQEKMAKQLELLLKKDDEES